MDAPTPAETLAAKQAREDREDYAILAKTPAAALTAVRMMMPVIDKLQAEINELKAPPPAPDQSLEDKLECLTYNVNCLAALLSVFIQELDPAAFKRGKEGVEKARRFAKEWQEDPGMVE